MTPRAEIAPAKINLALHVVGRRADGYHLLESLAIFTRFGDRLEFLPSDTDSLVVSGPFAAGVPTDGTNLVLKARDALRAAGSPAGTPPVEIRLEKNLPVASGIGGGSSDAAAALRGLARLWRLDMRPDELIRIGATLGADLPMCIAARPLIARGAGEALSPIHGFPALGLVLVNPGVAVSTPAVFAALAKRDNGPLPVLPDRMDLDTLLEWLKSTRNDLESAAAAVAPGIDAAKAALRDAGAAFARMSGSGATCFGIFATGNIAKRAAAAIRNRRPEWFVAATRSMPSEEPE